MIKINIQQTAKNNGILNAYSLQKSLKCSPTMASRLWKESFEQISLNTIQKLCDLFNCQSDDLILITPKNAPQIKKAVAIQVKQEKRTDELVIDDANGEKLLTTIAIAEMFNVKRRTVNDWITQKRLKSVKRSGVNYIRQSELEEFKKKFRPDQS